MDKSLEWKLRKLGPTPVRVLEHVLVKSTVTSAGTIAQLNLGDENTRAVGGGYSVLSRGGLVYPIGRNEAGSIRWEPSEAVKQNKDEILDLIRKMK